MNRATGISVWSGVLSRGSDRRGERFCALMVLAAMLWQPVAASAQVVADPNAGANKPKVESTANGIPLVQITNPSAGGVSHNQYSTFNVDSKGLILNNSPTITQTQQAGYVPANTDLKTPARIILNEVTGGGASQLRGYTEVAGNKAEVVIANQNGISCNGCGFINASRGVLTTGAPVFGGSGSLEAFRVAGGNIAVDGAGLDGSNLDRVELISRTVNVNAGLWAKELSVVTGANQVSYADLVTQPLTPVGSSPSVSLDVGALGGMYAGKIRLVGTEKGLGVASLGTIASNGEFTLSSDGKISLSGSTTAGGAMTVKTAGAFENQGTMYAGDTLRVEAGGAASNTSVMASRNHLKVTAESIRSTGTLAAGVTPDGQVSQAGHLVLSARQGIEGRGQLLAGGVVWAEGGRLALSSALLQAGGDTHLEAKSGDLLARGWNAQVGGELWASSAGATDASGGSVLAQSVRLEGDGIDLTRAQIQSVGALALEGRNGAIRSTEGLLHSGGALSISTTGGFEGQSGRLLGQSIQVNAGAIDLSSGSVAAAQDASLTSAGALGNRSGTIQAGGALTVNSAGALDNGGGKLLGTDVLVSARTMEQVGGSLEASRDLTLKVTGGGLVNRDGKLLANRQLAVSLAGGLENTGGTVMGGRVRLEADYLEQLDDRAIVAATDSAELYLKRWLTNQDGGTLFSLGDMVIAGSSERDANGEWVKTGTLLNSSGRIEADRNLTIAADAIVNKKSVFEYTAGRQISISERPGYEEYVGVMCVPGRCYGKYANKIYTATYEVLVLRDSPAGQLLSGDRMTLRVGYGGIENDKSQIAAGGDLDAKSEGGLRNPQYVPKAITKSWSEGWLRDNNYDYHGPYTSEPSTDSIDYDLASSKYAANDRQTVGVTRPLEQVANQVNVSGPGGAAPTFVFTAPQNGLFHTNPDPAAHYLVETDPRFTSLGAFLSSDYLLGRLGLDPAMVQKRLGDGFYEQRVVLDQVTLLTGRRYLDGQTDGEEEYRALMAEGAKYAKEFKLKVGVALTAEQMSKLTSPMVWLVSEQVKGQQVLVPKLYLPKVQTENLRPGGTITAGNGMYLDLAGDLVNDGSISAGGDVAMKARSIRSTGGSFEAGKTLTGVAEKEVALDAAVLDAGGRLHVEAKQGNVRLGTVSRETHSGTIVSGQWVDGSQVFGTRLESKESVTVVAGQDVRFDAAQVKAGQDLVLLARGGNVMVDGAVDSRREERIGSSSREKSYDESWKGTSLSAGKDLTVAAYGQGGADKGNVRITGATVQGGGRVVVYGQRDVELKEGREKHEWLKETVSHDSSWLGLSSTTTTTRDEAKSDLAKKNQLSGGALLLRGERDLILVGTEVAGAGDVSLSAGRDLSLLAAQDYVTETHERKVTTSGLMSNGVGLAIGTRTENGLVTSDSVANQGSLVGSVGGKVTLTAGEKALLVGSDVVGQQAVEISGKSVLIDAALDRQRLTNSSEVTQSGFGVSLSGGVVDAGSTIYGSAQRGSEVKDERLKALYALRASRTAIEAGDSLVRGSLTDGVRLEVGFSTSGSKMESRTQLTAARGSRISSSGDLTIVASGDPSREQGDLTVVGSSIQGENVRLEASRDLTLRSAANTMEQVTESSSYSAGLGVSAGVGKGNGGVGLSARGSLGDGNEREQGLTHTETLVSGSKQLSLKSGRDTTLQGAQASGDSLKVDVGRNLRMESEQDTASYHSKQKSLAGEAQLNVLGGSSASLSGNASWADSNYRSVNEQTGLFAGKGGYQIKVEGNTHLGAAVIGSEAGKEKNDLQTKTITWSKLENESRYNAQSVGLTVGTGGVTPSLGVPAQDQKRSTSYAAIGSGTIRTESDLTGLSRETSQANHPLKDGFDKQAVQEKQELATVFGQEAFKAVGDLSQALTRRYTNAQLGEEMATRYRELKGKGELTSEEQAFVGQMESAGYTPQNVDGVIAQAKADQERYRGQYETWKDGSAAKVLLHAAAGAAQAGFGGGSILAGGLGAGASEGFSPVTERLDPGLRQFASLGIGAAAGGLGGGLSGVGALSGGATALTGYQYNRSLHESEKAKIKELAKDYEKYGYGSEQEAELKLSLAACAMVHCAEQLPNGDPQRAEALKFQQAGEGLVKERELLSSVSKADWLQGTLPQRDTPGFVGAAPSRPLFDYNVADTTLDLADRYSLGTRAIGLSQMVGGGVTVAGAGALATTCETGIGCVGAGALFVNGVDNVTTGARKLVDGAPYSTQFNEALRQMGLSPEVAGYVELLSDAGTGALAGKALSGASKGLTLGETVSGGGPRVVERSPEVLDALEAAKVEQEAASPAIAAKLREQAAKDPGVVLGMGEEAKATASVSKFSDYVFKEGATHGKDAVFRELGYGKEHSDQLAQMWEQQAAAKYAKGEYTLGKRDQYGQRINIEIEIPGVGDAVGKTSYMRSGWMIQPDGSVKLNTPFSGFTR